VVPPVYRTELGQNYPNPFNPNTTLVYSLESQGDVKIVIYDVRGRRVCDLISGKRPAGVHKVVWDGKNGRGSRVASGVYFYEMVAGPYRATKKMTLLR
jgi:flagellar hook assembly protein FlgD